MERLTAQNHLEAVELGRIVGAGDLEPAVGLECGDGEVQRRRWECAHVDRGSTGLGDASADTPRELGPRGAIVSADGDGWRPAKACPGHTREGAADGTPQFGRQLLADDPSHVVLAEDGLRDVHRPRPRSEGTHSQGPASGRPVWVSVAAL